MIPMKNRLAALFLVPIMMSHFKSGGQSFANYIKALNSYVAVAPESSQIMRAIDFPVNLFTGTANINLPIATVTGMDISVPVALNYSGAGGIRVDELAGEAGLGWALSLGGEITREIRGTADEGTSTSAGLFNNPHTIQWYINTKRASPSGTIDEEDRASRGEFDLEPDIYYFKFGAKSGKFIYNDQLQKFECIDQEPLKIERITNGFSITDDDGTRYVFNSIIRTATAPRCTSVSPSTLGQDVITSWRMTRIVNAQQTDSIRFEYTSGMYEFRSAGSSTKYQLVDGPGALQTRFDLECYNLNRISGTIQLDRIYSSTDSLVLERAATGREDLPGAKAVARIRTYSRGGGGQKHVFTFDYDYFPRNLVVGAPSADLAAQKKSLRLLSLTDHGNWEPSANPLKWTFTYRPEDLPARLSYSQDFWGLNNSNTLNTLVPEQLLISPYGSNYLSGANRTPSPVYMQSGLLQSITHPTGGKTTFTYEPNTTSTAVPYVSSPSTRTVQHLISVFKGENEPFIADENTYDVSFNISQPTHPIVNLDHPNGGVIADITVFPAIGPAGSTSTSIDMTKPYFLLEGPSGRSLQNDQYKVHLDNGTYTMKLRKTSAMNNSAILGLIRVLSFSVTYKLMDSTFTSVPNYNCGGVRIKSIAETDPYSNTTIVKDYIYQDPATGASWGEIIGPSNNVYYDYAHRIDNSFPGGTLDVFSQYLVRTGNCVIPGNNPTQTPVIYSKVIERTSNGGQVHKTEHYFNTRKPFFPNTYPYIPPIDKEALRGKPLKSIVYQQSAPGVFLPSRMTAYSYDEEPNGLISGTTFEHEIPAIRCLPAGYSETSPNGVPAISSIYSTLIHRVYTAADSAVEYDVAGMPALSQWNAYVYGDANLKPVSVTRKNSKGDLKIEKYGYAADATDPDFQLSTPLAAMLSVSNRISMPFRYKAFENGNLLERSYKYAHFSGNQLLVDSISQAIYNNALETEAKIPDYDTYGNPLTVEGRGGRFRKYLWRKERNLPLATVTCRWPPVPCPGGDSSFLPPSSTLMSTAPS